VLSDAGACPVGTPDCCRERVSQDLDLVCGLRGRRARIQYLGVQGGIWKSSNRRPIAAIIEQVPAPTRPVTPPGQPDSSRIRPRLSMCPKEGRLAQFCHKPQHIGTRHAPTGCRASMSRGLGAVALPASKRLRQNSQTNARLVTGHAPAKRHQSLGFRPENRPLAARARVAPMACGPRDCVDSPLPVHDAFVRVQALKVP